MCLYHAEERTAARSAALLRRQNDLRAILVTKQEAPSGLSLAIAQGCCLKLEKLQISVSTYAVTRERMDILAGGLEVVRALPALKTLRVNFYNTIGVTSMLARALGRGSAPTLQHFSVHFAPLNDEDLAPLADMVEGRARIPGNPGCQGVKTFAANWCWLDRGSLATRIRLLRTLLLYSQSLAQSDSTLSWNATFEPSFIETQPPYLEALSVRLVDDETVPTRGVLKAALGLEELQFEALRNRRGDCALQPIIAVLRDGIGLQITLSRFDLDNALYIDFFNVLESSG